MIATCPEIVVVDGATLNPGDLSWDAFMELGSVTVYDHSPVDELPVRVANATAIITNKAPVREHLLSSLSRLRYIGVTATGYDIVDTKAAHAHGVVVTNVPGYGTRSVAQMTLALLLELAHRVGHHSDAVKKGRWSESPGFCFWDHPLLELEGRTMGIVGLGRIGQAVAALANAFGMKVISHTRSRAGHSSVDIDLVDLETIFRKSDVVSLHCPLTDENTGMVNLRRLRMMKPTALLINTSRGALVVTDDLCVALREGLIAGAALDVLDTEPPPRNHSLFNAENCIITPHIAWATREARTRLLNVAAMNLRAFFNGTPQHVVS